MGRFRTPPPPDSQEPVRIAFFSCQDWQAGYFGAHSAIAREDVDLVVCLGDYIYERNFYEGPRKDTLGANGDGEVQTLDEYRAKYRMYKGDPDLRAMHAAHPYMGIWDDHEVEDNYAGTLPGEATQQVRVPFLERRGAGYRSFYEYMPFAPVRNRPRRGHDLYRQLQVGGRSSCSCSTSASTATTSRAATASPPSAPRPRASRGPTSAGSSSTGSRRASSDRPPSGRSSATS